MVGQHWIPWRDNPAIMIPLTGKQKEPQISPACPSTTNLSMRRHLYVVIGLSAALCLVLLVISTALAVLYARGSDSKPEWRGLIFDYQNISDHYLTVAEANDELKRDNFNLREHNVWLGKQSRLLNQIFAKLNVTGRVLTLENLHLREQIVNLTSTNSQLDQHHDRLEQHTRELEADRFNLSQAVEKLTHSHTQLEEERQNLSETNALLRHERVQATEEASKLQEVNNHLREAVRDLNEKIEADAVLEIHCEETSRNSTRLQGTVVELQEENRRLSAVLEQKRQAASEQENRTREQMLVDTRQMNEAYNSFNLYCPVVDQKTNERLCKKCHSSWTLFQAKCYYFSSRLLTWEASRAWCQAQGGDLLIVNSKEEQTFMFGKSQATGGASDRVWIGMTDSQKEGQWNWVDGSQVSSDLQYWLSRPGLGTEPDNWTLDNPAGEDCGHIDTKESELNSWMDGSCDTAYRWICEKSVLY